MEAGEGGCLGGSATVYVYSGPMELDTSVHNPVKCPTLTPRSFSKRKINFLKTHPKASLPSYHWECFVLTHSSMGGWVVRGGVEKGRGV
jgi:hypothetical protein